jgi:tetratricopeptide (TPR) repeat protein
MKRTAPFPGIFPLLFLGAGIFLAALASCTTWGASAEEYYSLGMAYFELGRFDEAEQWLNRARAANRTQTASEYNLGRIAFEAGRYEDAAKYFEAVLKKDPGNIMALNAAAYTRIKTGDLEAAEGYYQRVLALVPESADDGYNYALVLYAIEKYAEAEAVLGAHEFALLDNNDVLLLYARSQAAQDKIEAADSYAQWLANNSDPKVRYEYAGILEKAELYARALEEYRTALSGLSQDSADLKKTDIRYALARLLLIADAESAEGITELEAAVSEGFSGIETLEELLKDTRISAANRESLQTLIGSTRRALEEAALAETDQAGEQSAEEELEADVEGGSGGPDEG